MTTWREDAGSTDSRAIRVYDSVRTAHLERLQERPPGVLFYRKTSYDFDEELATAVGAVKRTRTGIFVGVVRSPASVVHVNEPMDMYCWPTTSAVYLATIVRRVILRRPTRVVTYAIENKDLGRALGNRFPWLPPAITRVVASFLPWALIRMTDRIVFGTPAAMRNYEALPGRVVDRVPNALIVGTSTPCHSCDISQKKDMSVVFLGAFDERKGVIPFLEAVKDCPADLRVDVLGKGPLLDAVMRLSAGDARIQVRHDPERTVIHDVLASSRVLVLPSIPTAEWVEQIGLPIVEGLAHGCIIVTTRQTGLASWLEERGHFVVDKATPEGIAQAILDALESSTAPADVVRELPRQDPRLVADDWLET